MLSHVRENALEGSSTLGMRVLAAETIEPARADRMFEKDRPRSDLADKALRDFQPSDQSPLPRSQPPGQHGRAHPRAEIDQRHDVMQIVAVIVLVRSGDQQMLAGDARRASEPFKMEASLGRPVRQRRVDDRLDRRQVSIAIRYEKRVS